MDVSERLTTEDLAREDYLSASHLHRYGLAVELCAGLRVADVGCGTGYGSALLGERAATVVGVDVDAEAVAGAIRAHGSERVSFVASDALEWLRSADPADLEALVQQLELLQDLHGGRDLSQVNDPQVRRAVEALHGLDLASLMEQAGADLGLVLFKELVEKAKDEQAV